MGNNKVVTIAVGTVAALFVVSLIVRFVLLSQYGLSGSWIFFGLPFGGIGLVVLLLRLGLINGGSRTGSMGAPWPYQIGVPQAPYAPQAPAPSVSQSLQELDRVRAAGAISDAEYFMRRQQIISAL